MFISLLTLITFDLSSIWSWRASHHHTNSKQIERNLSKSSDRIQHGLCRRRLVLTGSIWPLKPNCSLGVDLELDLQLDLSSRQ